MYSPNRKRQVIPFTTCSVIKHNATFIQHLCKVRKHFHYIKRHGLVVVGVKVLFEPKRRWFSRSYFF